MLFFAAEWSQPEDGVTLLPGAILVLQPWIDLSFSGVVAGKHSVRATFPEINATCVDVRAQLLAEL